MGKVMLKELLEKAPKISLKFLNLTSETCVNAGISMLGVGTDYCVLKLPKASCSIGHQVLLTMCLNAKSKNKRKFEIVGKVSELNLMTELSCEVKVQFNQFLKEEWLNFLGLLEKQQSDITKVVDELKTPKP